MTRIVGVTEPQRGLKRVIDEVAEEGAAIRAFDEMLSVRRSKSDAFPEAEVLEDVDRARREARGSTGAR